MLNIMIECPTVGTLVPTGLTSETVVLNSFFGPHDTPTKPRLFETPQMVTEGHMGRRRWPSPSGFRPLSARRRAIIGSPKRAQRPRSST